MERLRRTVVQLEEAKRLILDGEVARLRLALILLDNAVEVMLHRRTHSVLDRANFYSRLLSRLPPPPLDAEGEALRQEFTAMVMTRKKQKDVRRFFGEKVNLLAETGIVPQPTARALRHLHDYRNELQHEDHVRPASIRPATFVLFDIALDLLVEVEASPTIWESDGDYRWLRNYGIDEKWALGRDDVRDIIAAQLRAGLSLDADGLREALIAHLRSRLDRMEEHLAEIATVERDPLDLARMVRRLRRWDEGLPTEKADESGDLTPFDQLDAFQRWRDTAAGLAAIGEKLALFDRFGTLEDEIEPLETALQELVSAMSAAAELASDIERGA